jgi:hypothetical protein
VPRWSPGPGLGREAEGELGSCICYSAHPAPSLHREVEEGAHKLALGINIYMLQAVLGCTPNYLLQGQPSWLWLQVYALRVDQAGVSFGSRYKVVPNSPGTVYMLWVVLQYTPGIWYRAGPVSVFVMGLHCRMHAATLPASI